MRYAHCGPGLLTGVMLSAGAACFVPLRMAHGQAATAAVSPSLSSSLGVYVFPAKNQSATTQTADEGACYSWAKNQTGIDPMSVKPTAPATAPTANPSTAGNGTVAKGTVGGAAGGAVIGAIAGDAGKGAAIGAGVGAVTGVARRRAQKQAAAQEQQQQQAAAAQQASASVEQQKSAYKKAYGACMKGKGYSVE